MTQDETEDAQLVRRSRRCRCTTLHNRPPLQDPVLPPTTLLTRSLLSISLAYTRAKTDFGLTLPLPELSEPSPAPARVWEVALATP